MLCTANDTTQLESWDAIRLLAWLPGKGRVFIDSEGVIIQEYTTRAFLPGIQAYASQWWQHQLRMKDGIVQISGRLTNKQQASFDAKGCDKDDAAFIGVALRAAIPVVHRDADYEEPCAQALGILAHGISAACNVFGV